MPLNPRSQARRGKAEKSGRAKYAKAFEKTAGGMTQTEESALKDERKKKRSSKKR